MEKLTHDSEHVTVHGHRGKWYVVDDGWFKKNGNDPVHVFLMEHETYGDMAACVIVDEDARAASPIGLPRPMRHASRTLPRSSTLSVRTGQSSL